MSRKLTLSLESLAVETFAPATREDGRGTVAAHQVQPIGDSDAACGYNTQGPTCGPENTCGYYYDGCYETYVFSCYPCDYSVACDTFAGYTCEYCNGGGTDDTRCGVYVG